MSARKDTYTATAADGIRISFDRYGEGARRTAIVVCHGFFKSKESRVFQRMSALLAERYDVVCMDFRGHGRSGGCFTFSAKERADLEAVLDWTRARYQRIGLIGFSMGSAISIVTMRHHPGLIKTFIGVAGPSSFREIEFKFWHPAAIMNGIRGLGPGSGCRIGNLFLKKERAIDAVGELAGTPVLLIHGTHDVIVDVAHSRRLYEAAREPKRLEIFERGAHAEGLFRESPDRFMGLVLDWFGHTLGPDGA